MTFKVAVPKNLSDSGKNLLLKNNFELIELKNMDNSELLNKAKNANGIILGVNKFNDDNFKYLKNLKIIARTGVGFNNINCKLAARNGVWVTITPEGDYQETANAAFTAILSLGRHFPQINYSMYHNSFKQAREIPTHDLKNKTLGIIGYGRVGKALEKNAHYFGFNILINSHHPTVPKYGKYVDKITLLKNSDFISLNVPATPETFHMIDINELKLMKQSANIINFARGTLINTKALINALKNHEIDGAALDVYEQEPLPKTSELYKLNNVLLTPHIGGITIESRRKMAYDAASEITRVLTNKKPLWPVISNVQIN